MHVFNSLKSRMQSGSSSSPEDLLTTLYGAWGNACNLSVKNLAQISEEARRSNNPILVCGSGLAALVLAASGAKRIIALEPDPLWHRDMEFLRRFLGLGNLQIVLAPSKTEQGKGWYDFRPSNKDKFSAVVYDRASGSDRDTLSGLAAGIGAMLAPGFKIFIDKAERDSEKQAISHWANILGSLSVNIAKGEGKKTVAIVSMATPSGGSIERAQPMAQSMG
jgi:hypothetical protein